MRTGIWGYPAHLIKLRDGRILSTCGSRREPGDVRAVVSSDGGMTWDMGNGNRAQGRRGCSNSLKMDMMATPRRPLRRWQNRVGYSVSVQFPEDSILTARIITESDGITHTAVKRWEA